MRNKLAKIFLVLNFFVAFGYGVTAQSSSKAKPVFIIISSSPPLTEVFAAKEVRRYLYLRTGEILPIQKLEGSKLPTSGNVILIGSSNSAIIADFSELMKIQNPNQVLKSVGGSHTSILQ